MDKYLFLKNQLGGSKVWIALRIKMITHEDIRRLSKTKIVATPASGAEPRIFLSMWLDLSDEDKQSLIKVFYKQHQWTLGIFIYRDADGNIPECGKGMGINLMIFYVVEYLNLLAIASDKTPEELLKILSVFDNSNTFNNDLIKIAFGDIFGMGYDTDPLQTEEGELVLAKYISLAKIED
tara:strand:- start:159 stop:698 length:540 start_codon:yes stop_codon:yes gene_type:complete